MAIERINLYDSTSTANTNDNLYNYLLENAVPEYFDSVTKDENNAYIVCTVNGNPFLKLPISSGRIQLVLGNNDIFEGSTVDNAYGYAYKLTHGILLGAYSNSYAAYYRSVFTICKDDENNTVVILDKQNFIFSTSPSKNIMAFNSSTTNKNYPAIYLNSLDLSNIAGKTALCPIVVGDTANYTPNAFYMPYAQNRSEGILCIDGEKYYSNGIWCIKDE